MSCDSLGVKEQQGEGEEAREVSENGKRSTKRPTNREIAQACETIKGRGIKEIYLL